VPVLNLLSRPNLEGKEWREKTFLYNMDSVSEYLSWMLYPLGISITPEQVVIGREGWRYLGDRYERTRSVSRRSQIPADIEIGQRIGAATEMWERWLAGKGVRLFKIMLAPNKETIYPEYLPEWAKAVPPTATDALIAGVDPSRYIDLRRPLLAAKAMHKEALYYKTDSHWNTIGAGIAFRTFAREISRAAPELRWPTDAAFKVNRIQPCDGKDLANFLRLAKRLPDSEPIIDNPSLRIETTHYDFDSKRVIRRGGNPQIDAPLKPTLITSKSALNAKRVLWLRDSFGMAMAPWMAATFTEVVQLHWSKALAAGGRFTELVENWKPDYVFISVVERSSRYELFAANPPINITEMRPDFKLLHTTIPVYLHHIIKGAAQNEYRLSGLDPFIDYSLDAAVDTSEANVLKLEMACADNTQKVPMQLFWLKDGEPYYSEKYSIRYTANPGTHLIDLSTVHEWTRSRAVRRIRLDIDSQGTCSTFRLSNPGTGVLLNKELAGATSQLPTQIIHPPADRGSGLNK